MHTKFLLKGDMGCTLQSDRERDIDDFHIVAVYYKLPHTEGNLVILHNNGVYKDVDHMISSLCTAVRI